MAKFGQREAASVERSYRTPEIVQQRLRTLAALALRRGERVLDAGCGTGLLLEQQALAVGGGGRVDGLDASDDMLALARTRCADLAQVHLCQGSVEDLPYGDAAFDALSCAQTLLYVERLDAALAGFHRVLQPGGRLALIETDWSGAIMANDHQEVTARIFEGWAAGLAQPNLPKRLGPMLRAHGFGAPRVEAIPVLNPYWCEDSFSAGMYRGMVELARKRAFVSDDEAGAWLASIDRLIEEDGYFFCVNRFLFTAVRAA